MSSEDKAKLVIKLGQLNKLDDLRVIIDNLEIKEIQEICTTRIQENDLNTFFHYLMKGMIDSSETQKKRFEVVFYILAQCNEEEMNMKSTLDLVTRICVDVDSYLPDQIIQFVEQCLDSLKLKDSKTVYWKDFLPQLINVLFKIPVLDVNGITMSGVEYRSAIIKNIMLFKWRLEILTPLASMFREIDLTATEREQILGKLCENLFHLTATELPSLALQLFGLCNTPALIVVPVLYFQKYFNKNYYTREYDNLDSNTTHCDSIGPHSGQELQQIQETVLYHLSRSTEFKLNERDVVTVFRNLANTPHYLLTPFMMSTLLALSKVNRQPDMVRLSSSAILPFLRKVIQNNEHEKAMARNSLWCRQTFNRNTVDIDNMVSILIDQSITGLEVVTPGVVALAFTLLKAKRQPDLNSLGITFLHKFLKQRFIFGQGILRQLSELLFAHQECPQFSECLNTLTLTCTLTVAECTATVQSILEFLLLIPGLHAMRLISFVYPLIKMSPVIRDTLIEVLSKAMAQTDPQVRRFGVYGFCLLLKNLRNNNARRAVAGGGSVTCHNLSFTQGNISGFSLMSQSTLGNRDNPHRHFDMLALEIIGILRKCFNETCETKEILYEGLTRAIEFNHKLTSHLLIFMDWHFRSYFKVSGGVLVIVFDRVVKESDEGDIDIWDNLGKLVSFMATCVMICEQHQIAHDYKIIVDLLNTMLEKCDSITVESLILQNDRRSRVVGQQFLHLLEGIMAYAVIVSPATVIGSNKLMRRFHAVFKHHEKVTSELKILFMEKRGSGGSKSSKSKDPPTSTPNCTATETPAVEFTLTAAAQKEGDATAFKPVNIWETATMQKLLNMVFGGSSPPEYLKDLKEDENFKGYLLRTATSHIESYRHLPDYRHVKHSRRMLSFLCDVTKVVYANVKKLFENNTESVVTASLSLECFRQCLMTSDAVYKRKLEEYFTHFSDGTQNGYLFHEQVLDVIDTIHKLVDTSMNKDLHAVAASPVEFKKMQQNLLACLEILYNYLPTEHSSECSKVLNWLHTFCLNHVVDGKHLAMVFKLLFSQRQKYFDGDYFGSVAKQLSRVLGTFIELEDNHAPGSGFELKAVTEFTAETVMLHLSAALKQDIENVECTILKVKSMAAKIKFLGDRGAEDDHIQSLKTMERAICAHLIHIASALLHLTNTRLPVGTATDTLIRLLTQYLICLNNVCKHLIARHAVVPVVYSHIKFDKLIQVSGKPLAGRVYDLISYIDQNLLPDYGGDERQKEGSPRKKVDAPLKSKKKLIRETRSLPKLIRWIETLHKFVLLLGKKTSKDISGYLHQGVVRDFRIRLSGLNSQSDGDSSADENAENVEEDYYDESEAETVETNSSAGYEVSGTATERILKNVAKLKKKATSAAATTSTKKGGKRGRSTARKVPDAAVYVLNAINENTGPKSPVKKRARRSTRT